ncbi:polysaccharide deacetylase [Maritimibacter sp. 55A14]|uniref:polysaccharide deacetylase family protein n=1 Tax=Maritimibacter sp. 55A14 TaxID=2174844 RepID=UPI000D60DCED|nr:polysaccharide deacetylase family protein [Maritimibacter sp. 55A14]PWE32895.1 polysaccharide deacetylase [Maritimibacter sp. 55A14]
MTRAVGIIFHGIGTPKRDVEADEVPYWLSIEKFQAALDQITNGSSGIEYVVTFDDGNSSDYEIALPELIARGLHASFFVLSGRIGVPGFLDATQIRALRDAGMTIGSHGVSHRAWSELDGEELWEELSESREVLEEICGQPVTEAGIPFGKYTARVLRQLRHAGYTAAYTSDTGSMDREAFLRPRTSLTCDMSIESLMSVLSGPPRTIRRQIGMARRRWLP